MDIVIRHTVLGACIRRIKPDLLPYDDDVDPEVIRKLFKVQDAQVEVDQIDESSALIQGGERAGASQALIVDWYGETDEEVRREII